MVQNKRPNYCNSWSGLVLFECWTDIVLEQILTAIYAIYGGSNAVGNWGFGH